MHLHFLRRHIGTWDEFTTFGLAFSTNLCETNVRQEVIGVTGREQRLLPLVTSRVSGVIVCSWPTEGSIRVETSQESDFSEKVTSHFLFGFCNLADSHDFIPSALSLGKTITGTADTFVLLTV